MPRLPVNYTGSWDWTASSIRAQSRLRASVADKVAMAPLFPERQTVPLLAVVRCRAAYIIDTGQPRQADRHHYSGRDRAG